jgi:hemolysin activation/secretion protein
MNNIDQSAVRRVLGRTVLRLLTATAVLTPWAAQAQNSGPDAVSGIGQREAQQQKERDEALQRLNTPRPDVRLQVDRVPGTESAWPEETPCFPVHQVSLTGDSAKAFSWIIDQMARQEIPPSGQCLGPQGVNMVRAKVQNALIDRGWVTTRVLVPDQDLSTGHLALQVVPGRLRSIRMADASAVPRMVSSALATQPGELLNLRAIEQALENIKRVPTQDADFQIEPANEAGSQLGESNIVVTLKKRQPLRASAFLDDSGSDATGKLQGSATVSLDTPLQHNDLLYLTLNHSLGNPAGNASGTRGHTLHYSVPHQWWLFTANLSASRFQQLIGPGSAYAGESAQAEWKAQRMVYRDARTKLSLGAGIWRKSARNFVDDTEIQLQRRRTAGWMAEADVQTAWGSIQVSANTTFRHGTGAANAIAAPEALTGTGTSNFQVLSTQVQLSTTGAMLGLQGTLRSQWKFQIHGTRLPSPERFSIGSRYTVRGFDGTSSLIGDSGVVARNDWSVHVPRLGAQVYGALDAGMVSGPSSHTAGPGRTLVGAAVGLRGSVFHAVSYDVFAGHPVHRPDATPNNGLTGGFNLNVSY